jgi:hypothetical protein
MCGCSLRGFAVHLRQEVHSMPIANTLEDDFIPDPDPSDAPMDATITLVTLPAGPAARERFLRRLQGAAVGLVSQAALSSLDRTSDPTAIADGTSDQITYAIGYSTEKAIRTSKRWSHSAWQTQLIGFGATSVGTIALDALLSLMDRRGLKAETPPPTAKKIWQAQALPAAHVPAPAPPAPGAMDALAAAGTSQELDWHLGPQGANVGAAWKRLHQRAPASTQLPWHEVLVGHLDTGYIEHEALAWDMASTPRASTTVLHTRGYDYFGPPADADPRDEWMPGFPGHGTRISGAISGFDPGDDARPPFYGAAPGLRIVPYRVTDSVMSDHVQHNLAAAIGQAVASGCHIITICLGALRASKGVAAAVDAAYEAGVIVVCAAGQVWPNVIYPGKFNRTMTVSGIGPNRLPWGSAASGRTVDWCAPADEIRRIRVKPQGGGYQTGIYPRADGDGTSYATAITSGIAAMWLSYHGIAALRTRYAAELWMIPASFKMLVKASCARWPGGGTGNYGVGVIDADALLTQTLPPPGSLAREASARAGFDANH